MVENMERVGAGRADAAEGAAPAVESAALVAKGATPAAESAAPTAEKPAPHAYDAVCVASIRGVMEIFSGKWAFLVLEQLHVGTMRFGDLRRALGVSTKSLTDTLRHLEAHEIIQRTAYPTVPVTVEYSLTEKGRSFDEVLLAMKNWGRAHL